MRPPLLLQEARNLTEQAVAGEVTAAVVDVLELVEIEQDQAQRTRRGVVQLALQAGLERALGGKSRSASRATPARLGAPSRHAGHPQTPVVAAPIAACARSGAGSASWL